jgi:hypothetical protein
MKTSCRFAATVVMCLLALSPAVAEDPPSATDQSKAPVVAGEPQETRPVVQENSEQRPDGSAATKSERPGDPKQPEKVEAVGVKGSQQGEGAARKGTEVSKTGEKKGQDA